MPSKIVIVPKAKSWLRAMILAIIPGLGHFYGGTGEQGTTLAY